MDRKVAIVTWWSNVNYGSILQAYALQTAVQSLGYDTEFVWLRTEQDAWFRRPIRNLKDLVVRARWPSLHASRMKMKQFIRERLQVSPRYASYGKLQDVANEVYCAAICGSDQIWSNADGRIDPLYYLTFIDEKRRIAYAPSIGYNGVSPDLANCFAEHVLHIPFRSVREARGASIIGELTGLSVPVVLDPCLLLTRLQWEAEIGERSVSSSEKPYVLWYFVGTNPAYVPAARDLSQRLGYLTLSLETRRLDLAGTTRQVAGPLDFVALIRNADWVVTDSFHGTVFSILFGKPFTVVKRFGDDDPRGQNSRIYNILEKTGLMDRLVSVTTAPWPLQWSVDHTVVDRIVSAERTSSLRFLKESLAGATGTIGSSAESTGSSAVDVVWGTR